MTSVRRVARAMSSSVTGTVLLLVGVGLFAVAPTARAMEGDGTPSWSIATLDGGSPSTSGLLGGRLIVPSETVEGGYVIEHSGATGPLDVRAAAETAPSPFEDDLIVTFTPPGGKPLAIGLRELVRDGAVVRLADALPDGPFTLGVSATLAPESSEVSRDSLARFSFVFTLSGDELVVPPDAAPGGHRGGRLVSTGVDPGPVFALALVIVAAGLLLLGVLPRRREDDREAW